MDGTLSRYLRQQNVAGNLRAIQYMATLEVSQPEGNDHHHSISLARFHMNPSNL